MGSQITVTLLKAATSALSVQRDSFKGSIDQDRLVAGAAPAAPTHCVALHCQPQSQIIRKFTATPGVY